MEDLLDKSLAVKYYTIKALAEWVGSQATDADICRLAGAKLKDHGEKILYEIRV